MDWHNDLYLGKSVQKKKKRLLYRISHRSRWVMAYVITTAAGPGSLLDIIPARELSKKHYPIKDLYITGIAGNYREALELAGMIVSEVYRETGGFDVKAYLLKKQERKG